MSELLARLRGWWFALQARLWHRRTRVVGRGLRIYGKWRITGPGRIVLGQRCTIGSAWGDPHQFTCIEARRPQAVIAIGDDVQLWGARLSATYAIHIGTGALIEESALLDSDLHSIDRHRGPPRHETAPSCAITVGRRVLIGARCLILKGVTIHDEARIAPGAIVTGVIAPGAFAHGNPARAVVTPS